jgi:hypothetical protein
VDDDEDTVDDDADDNSIEPLLTDERKANLFQCLLRDLQVEGVPLLGIDADQVQTLQAAIWTTMAGLLATAVGDGEEESASAASSLSPSSSDIVVDPKTAESTPEQQSTSTGSSNVCLVFEDIPMDALQAFVQDFQMIQNDQHLPELLAFRIALVGNGIGPAIAVTVQIDDTAADNFKDHTNPLAIIDKTYAGDGVLRATEAFVQRVVQNSDDGVGMTQPIYRYTAGQARNAVVTSTHGSIVENTGTTATASALIPPRRVKAPVDRDTPILGHSRNCPNGL